MRAMMLSCSLLLSVLLLSTTAKAETCQYETRWGVPTIEFNYAFNTFKGGYTHKQGKVNGVLNGNVGEGTWAQTDGNGAMVLHFNRSGFTGKWRSSGDTGWRGEWNGNLKNCW